MPRSTNALPDEASRLLRDLAVHQGLAYCTYGEALQRFGKRDIGWTDLFRTSGDIYYREATRVFWTLLTADFNGYASLLSMAAGKTHRPEADVAQRATTERKSGRRGRP
jgi:hypothetical protein